MPKPSFKRKASKPRSVPYVYEFGKAGAAAIYKTEKELTDVCTAYFITFAEDKKLRWSLPSKAGLLRHLDISRTQYSAYRKKYPNAIRRADALIEEAWVGGLNNANATGRIFYLKNAFKEEYQDRVENDLTSKGEKISALAVIQDQTRKILEEANPKEK